MGKIKWTEKASSNLQAIHDYIAKGLPENKIAGILEIKPQINADERRFVVRY